MNFLEIVTISFISAGQPYKWTGMIALVFFVIFDSIQLISIEKVFSFISTKTGSAPTLLTASAVEIQDNAGTMTSSPGPIFRDFIIISNASVPFPHPRQYFVPR